MRVDWNWLVLSAVMLIGITIITIIADLNLVPLFLWQTPMFDKLGHFGLFGLLAFLLHLALRFRAVRVWGISIPLALVVVMGFCVTDEIHQAVTLTRSADLLDLIADLAGVIFFLFLAERLNFKSREPRARA